MQGELPGLLDDCKPEMSLLALLVDDTELLRFVLDKKQKKKQFFELCIRRRI